MNAITMKLESKQLPVPNTKEKTRVSLVGKKCKNNRKKSTPANTDKDAVLKNHGLGRKSGDSFEITDSNSNMPLEFISPKKARPKKVNSKLNEKMPPKSEKMQERLEQFLSPGIKEKISSILNDVRSLTDVEKLYLYLQLPTGASMEIDPLKPKGQNPLGKKADEEGMIAVTWIQSHFEEDPDVSLPKQEVYNEYQSYCQMTKTDSLCAADFGKVMKQIFPFVKPRRLGTRGNSRYCYSGLRKKVKLECPKLPDMQTEIEISNSNEEPSKDETTSAACHILFQWAEKLLGLKFTSLKSLASHLLENMYVDHRSVAAFTVLLESSPQILEKGISNCEGGVKKSDAQMHLQRKIQEKELIKEQKKKMQEQRTSIAVLNKNKTPLPKKKPGKSKKSKSILNTDVVDCTLNKDDYLISKNNESSSEGTLLQENLSFEIKQEDSESVSVVSHTSPSVESRGEQPFKVTSPLTSSSDVEDSSKKSNYLLSPSTTPVCIAQTLPGIIIVPSSLPQLAEMGKQTPGTPKYKRIQPKPFREGLSSVMRSRAGSVGSASKTKTRSSDGRRSSHAWLQSAGSPEECEDKSTSNVKGPSLKPNPQKIVGLRRNSFVLPKDASAVLDTSVLDAVNPQLTGAAAVEIIANLNQSQVSNKNISELMLKSNLSGDCGLPSEEGSAVKRHIDESAGQSASKRAHMDSRQNLGTTLDSLLGWSKDIYANSNLPGQSTSIQPSSGVCEEEVSVHEIEGDALVDYMRGPNCNSVFSSVTDIKDNLSANKHLSTASKTQLSQLRMLLEQNLPRRISNSSIGSLKETTKSNTLNELNSYSFPKLVNTEVLNEKIESLPNLSGITDQMNFTGICNSEVFANSLCIEKFSSNKVQNGPLEKFLSVELSIQDTINEHNELLSDPSIFLNSAKNDSSKMDVSLNSGLSNLKQNVDANNYLHNLNVIPDVGERIISDQMNSSVFSGLVNTYTQVPSVPQSPNTRRRAFNFTPISPRHTPIPEGLNTGTTNISSPILNQYPRNTMSIAVGPSQPPSNAGSPFVSPRSTPVSMCRSRHSSDQSTYSTSRHTPFQNFDSGVSSVSSSPFISPQPTPIPVSRLRHNSSHGSGKTVTFSAINNPQIMGPLRSRHSSGPGWSAPQSPLVSEPFAFPETGRSRHSSSPVSSEQASSSSSCTSNLPDLPSGSFLTDGGGDLLIGGANLRHVRQRHASSSVIYSKPAPGLQRAGGGSRSQSVPLHQMLANLDSLGLGDEVRFSFPLSPDKSSPQMEWTGLEPPLSDDLQTTLEDLRDCDTDFSKFAQELELSQNDGSLQYDVK